MGATKYGIGAVIAFVVGVSGVAQARSATPLGEYRGVKVLEAEPTPPEVPAVVAPAPVAPAPVTADPAPSPPPTVAATVTTHPAPAPIRVLHFCDRPFAQPDLTLGSDANFDQDLSRALKTHAHIVVDLTQPYPDQGAAPAALEPWLAEVKANGGLITVKQYCEAARGNLGSWLASILGIHAGGLYRTARQYDVILHTDALDHVITQVEFSPKPGARGG